MTKRCTTPLALCLLLTGGHYFHASTFTQPPQPPLTYIKMQSDDTRLVCGALREAQRHFTTAQEPFGLKRNGQWGRENPTIPTIISATKDHLHREGLTFTQQRIEYPVRMMVGTLTHTPSGQFISTQVPIPHSYHGAPQSWQYVFLWIYTYATLLGVPVDLENYTEEHDQESAQAQQQIQQ